MRRANCLHLSGRKCGLKLFGGKPSIGCCSECESRRALDPARPAVVEVCDRCGALVHDVSQCPMPEGHEQHDPADDPCCDSPPPP
jgi:hypothetical protein